MKAQEKERRKMEKATHINDFIGGLPKIVAKKIWKVTDESGAVVQYVSGANNLKSNAQAYIDQKYPGKKMSLTFSHTKGLITVVC